MFGLVDLDRYVFDGCLSEIRYGKLHENRHAGRLGSRGRPQIGNGQIRLRLAGAVDQMKLHAGGGQLGKSLP